MGLVASCLDRLVVDQYPGLRSSSMSIMCAACTHEAIGVDAAWQDVCGGILRCRCNHCRATVDLAWLTASSLHATPPSELSAQLDRATAALDKYAASAPADPSEEHLLRRSELASVLVKHEQGLAPPAARSGPTTWVALPDSAATSASWHLYAVCEHAPCVHILARPIGPVEFTLVRRAAGTLVRPL